MPRPFPEGGLNSALNKSGGNSPILSRLVTLTGCHSTDLQSVLVTAPCSKDTRCVLPNGTKWSIILTIVIVRERAMDREKLLTRITVNPGVLVGKPTIRGMRISVEQILDALAAGVSQRDLLEDYPMLEPEDIQAVLLYARDIIASERIYPVDFPVPA